MYTFPVYRYVTIDGIQTRLSATAEKKWRKGRGTTTLHEMLDKFSDSKHRLGIRIVTNG